MSTFSLLRRTLRLAALLAPLALAVPGHAQLYIAPRGFANIPLGTFGDGYNLGAGGTLGLGLKKDQWRFALNGGLTQHTAKNVAAPLERSFDYAQITFSADYQFSDRTLAPFAGLELGGAFGRINQNIIGDRTRGFETNKSMVLVAPYGGLRWNASERIALDLFAKLNIFLLAEGSAAGADDVFMSVPVGLGLNIGLGDSEGSSASASTADRDNDGVADRKDKCPDEPGLVQYNGCPEVPMAEVKSLEDKLNLIAKRVLFATSSAAIEPASYRDLDEMTKIMRKYPNTRFAIEGHTDNTGIADANKKLSQERADAVKTYLVGKGIEATRLNAIGYGQERPLGSNDTDAGRQLNRRVEIHLSK